MQLSRIHSICILYSKMQYFKLLEDTELISSPVNMRHICVLLFKFFRLTKRDTEGKATSLMSQTRREHKTTQPATQAHFLCSFNSIQKGSFFPLKKSTMLSDRNSASLILKLDF